MLKNIAIGVSATVIAALVINAIGINNIKPVDWHAFIGDSTVSSDKIMKDDLANTVSAVINDTGDGDNTSLSERLMHSLKKNKGNYEVRIMLDSLYNNTIDTLPGLEEFLSKIKNDTKTELLNKGYSPHSVDSIMRDSIFIQSMRDTLIGTIKTGFMIGIDSLLFEKMSQIYETDSTCKYDQSQTVNAEHVFIDSRDGNSYAVVSIGNQLWMANNLNIKTNKSWCYGNDSNNCKKYGRLYNWAAATKACPEGWVLPTKNDWEQLSEYVGKEDSIRSYKLRSKFGWYSADVGDDAYNFMAIPGGFYSDKRFNFACMLGYYWSSTELNQDVAFGRVIGNGAFSQKSILKTDAISVRCIKHGS